MQIFLNGQAIKTQQSTLDMLLSEQGFIDMNVATAINQTFVANNERAVTQLQDGDNVDIVAPMQGG